MSFDGDTYDPKLDKHRLNTQLEAVKAIMLDGEWRTFDKIKSHLALCYSLSASEASISARLRDLRKPKFGGFTVERKRMRESGLWAYRVVRPS